MYTFIDFVQIQYRDCAQTPLISGYFPHVHDDRGIMLTRASNHDSFLLCFNQIGKIGKITRNVLHMRTLSCLRVL